MDSNLFTLFRRITSGVYVIGVAHGNRHDAFTASSVLQISYSPLLLMLGVNPDHAAYGLLRGGSVFSVCVLKHDQLSLAAHFAQPFLSDVDKFAGQRWHPGRSGVPLLDEALAYFECETVGEWPAGDHRIVLGEVVAGGILDITATPMLYAQTGDLDNSSALFPSQFSSLTTVP